MHLEYYGIDSFTDYVVEGDLYSEALYYHLYLEFKYTFGPAASSDCAIKIRRGINITIRNNHIYNGLIGITVDRSRDVLIHDNFLHQLANTALAHGFDSRITLFFNNVVFNSKIGIRNHGFDEEDGDLRSINIYHNLFWNRGYWGRIFYTHVWEEYPHYWYYPLVRIHHNTAVGAFGFINMGTSIIEHGKLKSFRVTNNIAKSEEYCYWGSSTYEETGGYIGSLNDNYFVGEDPWYGKMKVFLDSNSFIKQNDGLLWNRFVEPNFRFRNHHNLILSY